MNKCQFRAKDGIDYTIVIDDGGCQIDVLNGEIRLGEMSFRLIGGASVFEPDSFLIIYLGLDRCANLGIGRRCLQFHRELFGSPITAGRSDGGTSDDGSHLTGNGPGFVEKMRAEGLIVKSRDDAS